MNTQQQNSRLTSLPVVMFLAGICCFLWGSATPAIKTGYRLFQIQSSDAMSIIFICRNAFPVGRFSGDPFSQHPGTPLDHASEGIRKSDPGTLLKSDGPSVLFLLHRTGTCQRGTWSDHHRRKCFYFYFSCQPDLPV